MPAVLLSSAGHVLWSVGNTGLSTSGKAGAVDVLQAEMLSCESTDYFSCLIIHVNTS